MSEFSGSSLQKNGGRIPPQDIRVNANRGNFPFFVITASPVRNTSVPTGCVSGQAKMVSFDRPDMPHDFYRRLLKTSVLPLAAPQKMKRLGDAFHIKCWSGVAFRRPGRSVGEVKMAANVPRCCIN